LARFLDTTNLLCNKDSKYPNTYPTEEIVKGTLEDLGINTHDPIVLYAQQHKDSSMTRVYHILTSFGFTNVSILDGGLLKYTEDGFPVTPGIDYSGPKSKIRRLHDPHSYLTKMNEIVEFALGKKSKMQLFDFRDENSFNGHDPNPFPGCRQGHVPGAINISADFFINQENDTFKSKEEIVDLFTSHGIDWKKEIVCMCKTGVSATIGYFALTLIGHKGHKLYDGSWTEYGSNDTPSTPEIPKMPISIPQMPVSMPMYMQTGPIPTPKYFVVPSGDYYISLQNQNDHEPFYSH